MTSPRTPKASRRQKVSSKGVLNAVRTERKAGLFRHGQPTAHLVGSMKDSRHFCGK
jgi:hypothetical protein